MNDKNKNLVVRVASVAVLLPSFLFLVARGGLWAGGLFAAVAALCTSEYYGLAFKRLAAPAWVGIAAAGAVPLFPFLFAAPGEAAFWWTGGFLFFAWISQLVKGSVATAPASTAHLLLGMLYPALGLLALSQLRGLPAGLGWVTATLVVTWTNDTFAYFGGRLFGRHKLAPKISPNKTWEGWLGGLAGAVAGLFLYRALLSTPLALCDVWALAIAGSVFGPLGDLCESMLKRGFGAKDSGRIIPGHGGVLDRIDALLFNAPVVFVYLQFLRPWLLHSGGGV